MPSTSSAIPCDDKVLPWVTPFELSARVEYVSLFGLCVRTRSASMSSHNRSRRFARTSYLDTQPRHLAQRGHKPSFAAPEDFGHLSRCRVLLPQRARLLFRRILSKH